MTETATDSGVVFRAGKLETRTLVAATEGAPGVDIGKLLSEGGVVTWTVSGRTSSSIRR